MPHNKPSPLPVAGDGPFPGQSQNSPFQQFPNGTTPAQNGVRPSGTPLPESAWKSPAQIAVEKHLKK